MNLLLYSISSQRADTSRSGVHDSRLMLLGGSHRDLAQVIRTMGFVRAALPNESPMELTIHELVVTV